jgi:hypothetical protein
MRLFGGLIASSAAFALIGGLAIGSAQAAPAVGKVAVSSQLDLIAAKKKKKSAKKGGPGTCGVMNYWDKKTKKCTSAMTKKA